MIPRGLSVDGISAQVLKVRERIGRAAEQSLRAPETVRMIAVTKYATADEGFIESLFSAGCHDFGESRPQSLVEKGGRFAGEKKIAWHFIGTLQKNKIRKILPYTHLIHSVDSVELYNQIARIAVEEQIATVEVLLEVRLSADTTKHGFNPTELIDALGAMRHENIVVRGLMGMGGLTATPTELRRQFSSLRTLLEKCREAFPHGNRLTELSMGMSDDFEIAIQEGATMVRIGSLLYE